MRTTETLLAEWDAVKLIKVFEMPVENMDTGEKDGYIVWSISGNEKGLTARASENLFEDVCNVGWDEDFSLDAHLEQLHELCWYAVNDDNTFTHRDDE